MREIPVKDVRQFLSDSINRVVFGGERVVITRHGKGVVGLVSMEDLEALEKQQKKSKEQKRGTA